MAYISKMNTKIQSILPSLSKAEAKAAEYVLENYGKIMYLSVTEMAENSKVGETTIFRFCNKIGFSGYHEFKLAIAQDVVRLNALDEKEEQPKDFADNIKTNIINRINECYTSLNVENLRKAIEMIYNAENVYYFGIGSSRLSASTAQERFLRIGIMSNLGLDGHRQGVLASIADEHDVIVAFSISGNTKDVIEALEIAKKSNVKTIVITSYIKSPITQYADIVLQTAGKEHLMEGGTLASSISQLYIIDLLVTGASLIDKDETMMKKTKIGEAIINKFYK